MKSAFIIFGLLSFSAPQKSEAGLLDRVRSMLQPRARVVQRMSIPTFRTECSNGVCRRVPAK